jgi:hypothetical protein
MLNPRLIHSNENVTSIACLLSRSSAESKKRGAALAVLRISGSSSDLEVLLLSEEETVEHFDVIEMQENNSYAIAAVEETGTVWLSPYSTPSELLQQREDSKLPITEESMQSVNKVVKMQKLLYLIRPCEPRRYDTYKDTK